VCQTQHEPEKAFGLIENQRSQAGASGGGGGGRRMGGGGSWAGGVGWGGGGGGERGETWREKGRGEGSARISVLINESSLKKIVSNERDSLSYPL